MKNLFFTKKVLAGCAVAAIAAVVAFNVVVGDSNKINLSDLALADVEALAQNEAGECGGDGTACVCCPIWNVTVNKSTWEEICNTGGGYKCMNCTCLG